MKNKQLFGAGVRDGMPVCLGYIAVGFSIGIAAKNVGLNAFQGFLLSFLNNASAGEYAGLTVMAGAGTYLEIALMTLVANARYLLMSCALSQRVSPEMKFGHRLLISYGITDELFGLGIARPGFVEPAYMYGAFLVALTGWSFGTVSGVLAGNVLSPRLVGALSVALFGMFIAIIIPPAKRDRAVLLCVIVSFAVSFAAAKLPVISEISEGTRTIVLTVVISAGAALLFPVKESTCEGNESNENRLDR